MNKRSGILRLIVLVFVIAFLAFTALVGLGKDKSGSASTIKQGLDLAGGVSITYEIVDKNASDSDIRDTIYKLQRRIEGYSTEAVAYQVGDDRITVDIPGVADANRILEELGQPGTLSFIDVDGNEIMNGNNIKNAQAYSSTDQTTKAVEYGVQLTFDEEGQKIFSDFTANNIGKTLTIVYDKQIVSSPIIQSHITSETCVIEHIQDMETANNLATTIRIGALPTELSEVYSSVVGAKLGSQAIQTSIMAGIVGLVIVMILMLVLYRGMGLAADVALLIYTGLMVMLLSAFEVTLTLPGIAGIVLSIGMAVDANVIIFSRIKEEIGLGKTVSTAIKLGFSKALSAIVDGNITTLIAAAVLYLLGSGPIKGFAQTLALGIVLSMFTALIVTRFCLNALYGAGMKDVKFYGVTKDVKVINFLGKKNLCFIISLALIGVGIVGMIIGSVSGKNAFNYSLEFVGGTSTNVVMDKDYTIEELNATVMETVRGTIENSQVEVNKVAGSNEITIKTRTLTLEEREAMYDALVDEYGIDTEEITSQNISATVGKEMRSDATKAVIVAIILMLLYIWFRFQDIRFATSAILALVHDVLVTLGAYAICRWTVGTTFIACMLTIVGYSINATIVIFDRIREEAHEAGPRTGLVQIVNKAVSQTLTRSIYTSLTTLIMVLALFIFGVTTIREFALPLMVGIICGAYSSVCISAALWYVTRTKIGKKD